MKRKVVLTLVLLALLSLTTTSVVTASPGGPIYGPWSVYLASGYALGGVKVITHEYCPHACNVGGAGYAMHVGHGLEPADCMADASGYQTPNLVPIDTVRLIAWGPDSHGQVGELACIFWCCQPYPALMVFSWEFVEIEHE